MPAQPDVALQTLHVFLLKPHIKDTKDAIARGKTLLVKNASASVLPGATLYYRTPPARSADWREFLVSAFEGNLPEFKAQHASAVLFVPLKNRICAITFGHGDALLSPGALEPDFGVRTGLVLCEPSTLRAIDFRTIEERTRLSRVQLSSEAAVSAFRVDTSTDLLRGFEARSRDQSVCDRLAARWSSILVRSRVTIGDVPKMLAALVRCYQNKKLPKEFEWIENVQRVQDPTLTQGLDAELERRLDSRELNNIRLALPEIAGLSLKTEARLLKPDGDALDSDVSAYLDARPRAVKRTLEAAKLNHKVFLVDVANGAEREKISVYRCIVAEIEHAGEMYLLADGEWFQLNRDYVKEVDKVLSTVRPVPHALPPWPSKQDEGEYNAESCKAWTEAALLDKANVWYGGGHSRIEPADWVTRQRVFGYVKRRDKNSSGLSHLFSQGVVAAQLLSVDAAFRKRVAEKVPTTHKAVAAALREAKFTTSSWTVAYVILGVPAVNPTATLPFFSKVNLRKHIEQLRSMQFQVAIVGVPVA